ADLSTKERRKRSRALESHLEADLGDRELGHAEQGSCAPDSQSDQVVVRRLTEDTAEEPVEVMRREARFARDYGQRQRLRDARAREAARAAEPPIQLFARAGANSRNRGHLLPHLLLREQEPLRERVEAVLRPFGGGDSDPDARPQAAKLGDDAVVGGM